MSALQSMMSAIADERNRRDALGGTRERGNPPPDFVPNVDSQPLKGSPAKVVSSSVGTATTVYSANAGSTGPVYSGIAATTQFPQSSRNTTTSFGRPVPDAGASNPGPITAPTLTNVQATKLLPYGLYTMDQINQARATPA